MKTKVRSCGKFAGDLKQAREAAAAWMLAECAPDEDLHKSVVRLLLIARAEEADRCAKEAGRLYNTLGSEFEPEFRSRADELRKAAEEMK